MPWAAGSYTKGNAGSGGWTGDASLGIGIEAGRHDTQDNDFATGINQCLNKDGSNAMTGALNVGGNKVVSMAAGTADTDAMRYGQVRDGAPLYLDPTNNRIGIGTTGPTTQLDITGTSPVFTLMNTNNIANAGGVVRFNHYAFSTAKQLAEIRAQLVDGNVATRAGDLVFYTSTQATGTLTEKMRITDAGNCGIGTSSPAAKLVVVQNVNAAASTLGVEHQMASGQNTAALIVSKYDNTNTTSQVFVRFYINNVGTGSGMITANGASAAAFGTFSDVRLKENITDLPSQLDKIMALRPVEFDYKDGSGHQIGFIAQEVEPIYPDLVGIGDNDMLTLTGLSKNEARMIKAFQEFATLTQQKIALLEARIAALEA